MSNIYSSYLILTILIILTSCESKTNKANNTPWEDSTTNFQSDKLEKINTQIRKEKFDLIIPNAMRKHKIDMWIHVMRDALPDLNNQEDDLFGAEDLGSTSGIFVFTDRGGNRIERAVMGRRWGATQRQYEKDKSHLINELGIYDIIYDPIFVTEPLATTETEYDFRFKGLRKFVEERDPKRIAVNYRDELGPWGTTRIIRDGISHTDYRLLAKELGKKYSTRLVSSEYVIMDYCISPVPSEVELLKSMRQNELKLVDKAFSEIKPGKTKIENLGNTGDYEVDIVAFRRMYTGESQRGRSSGWENAIVQGGDIIAAPSQGKFAYVLRDGETEPPAEIQKIWSEYQKIEKIFAETIKAGLTSREIIQNYKKKFAEVDVIVIEPQMHMVQPKNNFPVYSKGHDQNKTLISIDCHGKGKGSRKWKHDIYLGPRIGSYGPEWTYDVPLAPNHHFVLEYFFYMPAPTANKNEDQYLLFWNHEQAVTTESGVKYLSPPQKDLFLIK
jgi:hypothetical protein